MSFTNALPARGARAARRLRAGLGFEMKTLRIFLSGFFSMILPNRRRRATAER
jgi:hypothetical protein